MPDDDRFPRGLPGKWWNVARSLTNGDSVDETGHLVSQALAQTLRRMGGVPGLAVIADRLWAATRHPNGRLSGGPPERHINTELAWRVAKAMLLSRGSELAALDRATVRARLARLVIEALADRYGFDRILPTLVAEGTFTGAQAHWIRRECLAQAETEKLATKLLARPDGVGLISPPHPRTPTADLLNTPLDRI